MTRAQDRADGMLIPVEPLYAAATFGLLAFDMFTTTGLRLDEALPGSGSIAERLHQWQASFTLPAEKTSLLPSFFQRALTEAKLRTQALVLLPADTQTEIQTIVDRPARAMARYLGTIARASISTLPSLFLSPISSTCYVMKDIPAIWRSLSSKMRFSSSRRDIWKNRCFCLVRRAMSSVKG